jgi:hypothetical protein
MPLWNTQNANFFNLAEKDLDGHIYRIMPEEWVLNMFSSRENTIAQPHKWKDKFENFLLNAGGVLNGERFQYGYQHDFVGQCWTSQSYSEAMWGIYADDRTKRYLRIRSTPRKLLTSLIDTHSQMPQDTCFIGKVKYEKERVLRDFLYNNGVLAISAKWFANSLLLKRLPFKHEREIRLLYFGDASNYAGGLYRYTIDPHDLITQMMADPNRDRGNWPTERDAIKKTTGFRKRIMRSKIYNPPEWDLARYNSAV